MIIRKPIAAGSFYPGGKNELIYQLDNFLSKTKKLPDCGAIKILIVPHAGYIYSGQTAAWGYKQISQENFNKVILLGNSHHFWLDKIFAPENLIWQTPLGKVLTDDLTIKRLAKENNLIQLNDKPHLPEQILEVQLPFLQRVLKNFKIIPLIFSNLEEGKIKALALTINKIWDEKTLLVVSSDLSHYPFYEDANAIDKKTIQSILSGDPDKFEEVKNKILNSGYRQLETTACSGEAIKTALNLGKFLKLEKIKLFFYQNSGDITGDYSHVVGYASIGFYEKCQN